MLASAKAVMWAGDDRLKLWFKSPNQAAAFVSSVFLVALWFVLNYRGPFRRSVIAATSLVGISAFIALVLTASRGGMLATLVASLVLVVFRFKSSIRANFKRWLMISGVVLLICGGAFAVTMAVHGSSSSADSNRWRMWRAAPAMFKAAPDGWGNPDAVGFAYHDWFETKPMGYVQLNLVNDHLTSVVALGWKKGLVYLFAWWSVLALLFVFAFKGASPLPAALWCSLVIASFFNVILGPYEVWVIPVLSVGLLIPAVKRLSWKGWTVALLFSVVMSVLSIAPLELLGEQPKIWYKNGVFKINGSNPRIFIVNDGRALAGPMLPQEVKSYYRDHPNAESVAIGMGLDSVPESTDIDTLVLSGVTAEQYIVSFDDDPNSVPVPKRIVLLSPLIVPSCVSPDLRKRSDVRIVIGAEIASQSDEYSKPQDWITIVPKEGPAIHGWMRFCVN